MAVEKYTIGGTVAETEAFEAFADIPQNRVLLAEKLTANTSVKPEVVEGLTTVEQVFEHFKPKIDIDFETEEGTSKKETLHFSNLGDFGVKGITTQSAFLNDLTMKKEQFQKVIKQLKTNKLLKQTLTDATSKQALLDSLHALIRELEEAK
jgi:predicted component of type VI protein secretion system